MTPFGLLSGFVGGWILICNLIFSASEWLSLNSNWQSLYSEGFSRDKIVLVMSSSEREHFFWVHKPSDFAVDAESLRENALNPKICRGTFGFCAETVWSSSLLILDTDLAFELAKRSPARSIVDEKSQDLSCSFWAEFKRHQQTIEERDCRLWWKSQVYWSNLRLLGNYSSGYGVLGFYSIEELVLFADAHFQSERLLIHFPSARLLID